MIYLDTNLFVYAAINEGEKGELSRKILTLIATGKIVGYTSLITWDEIFWVIKKERNQEIAVKEGENFLSFPKLNFLEVNQEIISLSQHFVSQYNLGPRDAIHAASALMNGIKEIVSDDADFDRVNEIKRIKLEEVR